MIPYKVDVAMERWPIANFVLIAVTIIISFAMFGPLGEWEGRRFGGDVPERVARELRAMGINPEAPEASGPTTVVDYFLLQPGNFHVSQLVGNIFIHGGFFHLFGNMLFLFVFGNAVNAKLGHVKYILIYLGVGVIESCIWMIAGPGAPSLGASGAIMGIVGAFLVLYPLNDVSLGYFFSVRFCGSFEIAAMWVIAFYFGMDVYHLLIAHDSAVAYLSHVVGFLTGAVATAAILRMHIVQMNEHEKSLLQVWGWMPSEAVDRPIRDETFLQGARAVSSPAPRAASSAAVTAAPARRYHPPKDDTPVDLI